MKDFPMLVHAVLETRMSAPPLPPTHSAALSRWVFALPPPPRVATPAADAVKRGEALFHDANVGCATCHAGARLTSNATVDVGTGGAFQVPSLVGVASRPPFLHNGCAPTLRDRFGTCGGG